MTSPTTHTPATASGTPTIGGPRITPAEGFPRARTFAMVGGHLVIVNALGKRGTTNVPAPTKDNPDRVEERRVIDEGAPFAEVHLVRTEATAKSKIGDFKKAPADFPIGEPQRDEEDPRRDGGEIFNVPFDQIQRAPWSVVRPIYEARNGADDVPHVLWAKRAGHPLTAEEEAQVPALLETEAKAVADAQFIATHEISKKVEAEIERRRLAFVAEVAELREATAKKLLAERDTKQGT